MAIVTKNSRLNKINAEYDQLSSTWTNVADVMNRNLLQLKNFAAWRNKMFIDNSGDIDVEDMQAYKAQFDEIFAKIMPTFVVLNELNTMPGEPPATFESANNDFIAKYGLDVVEYDKKFK